MKQCRINGRLTVITIYIIIVLYSIVLLSCDDPTGPNVEDVNYEVPELLNEQEPEDEIVEVQEESEEKLIIKPVDEPEEPMEEIMNLKPIENYAHYAFADGKLKGLGGDQAETCGLEDTEGKEIPIDDFYVKDLALFFSVKVMEQGAVIPETEPVQYEALEKTYYFTQVPSYDPVEITAAEFVKPDPQRVTMIEGKYKIQDLPYSGVPGGVVTNVKQVLKYEIVDGEKVEIEKPNKNFITVDGFYLSDNGLWFSVPEGVKGAESGLWFIADESLRFVNRGEYGRIW